MISKIKKNKIPRCIYCGNLADIGFENYVYPFVDVDDIESIKVFIDSVYCLPSKKTTQEGQFIKYDSRSGLENNEIHVKDTRMIKSGITNINKKLKRIRYFVFNRNHKVYIQNGIYICDCGKTLWSDGDTTSLAAYSERAGYDSKFSSFVQNTISKNRRR